MFSATLCCVDIVKDWAYCCSCVSSLCLAPAADRKWVDRLRAMLCSNSYGVILCFCQAMCSMQCHLLV